MIWIIAVLLACLTLLVGVALWQGKITVDGLIEGVQSITLRVFFSPKYWFAAVIVLAIVELVTGAVSERFFSLQTEFQLVIIVSLGTLALGGYWIAGYLLRKTYSPNFRQAVVLNPEWGGEFDVLEGGQERFAEMEIQGADELREKRTPGGTRVYLMRKYDAATNTATASWKALYDELEVERTANAIASNTQTLENTLDEAREIRAAAVSFKQQIYDKVYSEVIAKVEAHLTSSEIDSQHTMAETVEKFETENLAEEIADEVGRVDNDDESGGPAESPQDAAHEAGGGDGGNPSNAGGGGQTGDATGGDAGADTRGDAQQ